jgi:uncharacterized MAPEG superfamily protein
MGFVVISILVAAVLPFVWLLATAWPTSSPAAVARWGPGWDNHDVRASSRQLVGWRRRAHLAQLNGHEAFAPFAAALILTELARVPTTWVRPLAVVYLVLRVFYGICYVADWSLWRTVMWSAAALAVLALFAAALVSA